MLAGYSRRLPRKSTSSTPANPNPDESVNLLSALCSSRRPRRASASTPSRSTLSSSRCKRSTAYGRQGGGRSHPKAHQNSRQEGFGWNQGCITESTLQGKICDRRLAPRATAPPPAHSDHPYAASPLRLPLLPIRPGVFLQIIVEDEQTTARGRPDRACGNTVLPRRHLAGFPDQSPGPSDDSRERPHP